MLSHFRLKSIKEETIVIDIIDENVEDSKLFFPHIPVKIEEVPLMKKRDRTLCHECGNLVTLSYFTTHMFEMHYKSTDTPSPHILCPECGVLCRNKRTFKIHQRIHTFKCGDCPSIFKTKELLEDHRKVHEEKQIQYVCEKCDSVFHTAFDFIVHKEKHEDSNSYQCVICSYKTNKTATLKRHLCQHEGRPVYTCEICKKQFFGEGKLKSHLELHAGIKQYQCNLCVKRFNTLNYLKVHKDLNHHKELYGFELCYTCPECGRKFTFEASLKRHLSTIHKIGKDRTVACPVCYKKIANNYNLKVHMRMHTGEKTNMCDSCGKTYHTYKSYKQHVLKHHPGQVPVPLTEPKSLPKIPV